MDINRLRENLDVLWYACGAGNPEKVASIDYFNGLQKEATDKEMLGESFCKLAEALNDDPWLVADDVLNNFDVYQRLSKTAGDTKSKELAQFYVGWADDLEKRAQWWSKLISGGRSALKSVGNWLKGPPGMQSAGKIGKTQLSRYTPPRPTRAEMMKRYADPGGKSRLRKVMEGRKMDPKRVDPGRLKRMYQAPPEYSLGKKLVGGAMLAAPVAGYMALSGREEPRQPYYGQYYQSRG